MSSPKICFAVIASGLLAVTAACSNDAKDAPATKQGVEGACEHINDVCYETEGFTTQNCAITKASYAKLSAVQKAKTDAVVPCVLAATTCEPALACMQSSKEDEAATGANDETTPAIDAEAACEHINDVCSGEDGFESQDCSGSNAAYAKLEAKAKATADSIAPCIMDAETCTAAFACLRPVSGQQ
jgi:hypothetical protein